MKGTFTIKSDVSERDLLESCFNYHHSGYDYKLLLLFHALAHGWKSYKLIYYIDLIEEEK